MFMQGTNFVKCIDSVVSLIHLLASFNLIELCHFIDLIIWISLYVFYVHFLCFYRVITTEFLVVHAPLFAN